MNELLTHVPPTQFWLSVSNWDVQFMSARVYVCLSHPLGGRGAGGGAGVCQGHPHHGRQQICMLGRHQFMTQWGVGQIQHQQEAHCIDKLGGAFVERQTAHGKVSSYLSRGGNRGQGDQPTVEAQITLQAQGWEASATWDSCTIQEEPSKRSPLLDGAVHVPIHKWVGAQGPCQAC